MNFCQTMLETTGYPGEFLFPPEVFKEWMICWMYTPLHSPEGVVRMEAPAHTSGSGSTGSNRDAIMTLAHATDYCDSNSDGLITNVHPKEFSISASTKVRFTGERYVYGWLSHRLSNSTAPSLSLAVEARQFSSFIVMIGSISSVTTFDPKHAFIIQNKDMMVIPLLLETLPSPKEFRKAVETLFPEQQPFAKAFGAMQLESTLFAVCVVQIKPRL